jgi:hypothetical protein
MKGRSLYLHLGKVIHPRVYQTVQRNMSPLTPEIRTKDSYQPSQGCLIKQIQSSLPTSQ